MATGQPQKSFSELKKSRKYRELIRKNSRRLHLEQLEDRRLMALGPNLVAILPNSGSLLLEGDVRHVAPKDLTFRFAEGQSIDPATVATGIKLTRGGPDHAFGGGNDVVVTPGFIGLGNTNREVVMRFAETLPDDVYRVQIIGAGAGALKDIAGNPFNNGQNLTRNFTLDLGAQVVAIVPQPVVRTGTTLSQQRNQIVVYFNNDNLNVASAQNREFYRLCATRNTLDPADDVEFLPTGVVYDPVADTATLTFAQPIDQLFAGSVPGDIANSFRLRIGTSETARPTATTTVNPTSDPGSTFTLAQDLGATLTGGAQGGVTLINGRIVNNDLNTTDDQIYDLQWPGANDEPGHRQIPVEDHLQFGPDATDGITTVFYNFQHVIGAIPDGIGGSQPAFNLITDNQKQRVREIFDLYNRYAGVQFVETENQGITVATGDMRAINPNVTTGAGHPFGNSDIPSLRAIMDNAETWDDSYGGSWMQEAMQQIGRVLGMGYSFDLPPLTINGQDARLATPGVPLEPVFPGDDDIIHMQHLYRPESKDIDMYKFTLDATGVFRVETFAERLADSSLLDTYLRLYKVGVDGKPTVIAQNDDYFSKDSQIELTLGAGTYYLGVSAKGNDAYDPNVVDSGIGGTTQGGYHVKLDFRKSATTSIVDATGTAFDGDSDGTTGGVYNFWFKAAAPRGLELAGAPRTIFVDKAAADGGNGALTTPYNNLVTALSNARQHDIVRIVGNDQGTVTLSDDKAYHIGFNLLGNQLEDGTTLSVPKNVTVMIDAGAIFQLRRAQISAGSTNPAIASDHSGGALQVLGIPGKSVYFTSYNEQASALKTNIGADTNPFTTTPSPGDWGGISFKNDLDRADGRYVSEEVGVFLNYVNHADIRYGGGQVDVDSVVQVINPIHMTDARPAATYNTITRSADAAMSANPDSFEETNFAAPRYSPTATTSYTLDYSRVGPDIHGNLILNNTTNGIFVRTKTPAGSQLEEMTVAGRFDDTDIVHVMQENLFVTGTPGGPRQEVVAPPINLVVVTRLTSPAGSFSAGQTVEYKLVYVDLLGNEGLPSASTAPIAIAANNSSIRLTNMPIPSGNFVARRLYRRINGTGSFELVDQIPAQVTSFIDTNQSYHGATRVLLKNDSNPAAINRPRLDGSLVIDPTIVMKTDGAHIEVGVGANLIAEGFAGQEVVLTSVADDRYGAGGTFDTGNDQGLATPRVAGPGDWGGLFFSANSSGSVDHAVISYGGGLNRVQGSFAGFNAVEIHQADVRIADSEFEFNSSGIGGQAPPDRFGRGFNGDSLIFVRGAQPVIVNNIVHDNSGAFVNINANAMNNDTVVDLGRQRGLVDNVLGHYDNNGPLINGNRLVNNATNGMIVRGGVLTTESVWDDTDIAHVLFDAIDIPDFHTYGGLRLESQPTESLVVKSNGTSAGITAGGRPLEIADRIGGRLEVLGQPGFPVILTSLSDDTASAGYTPDGVPQGDTDGSGSTGGGTGGPTLPIGPEVNNGTLIDDDVATNTVGHFEFRPSAGGNALASGVTAQGQTLLAVNQDFIFDFTNYVDVGSNGGAIELRNTTITTPPTLLSDDLVFSEGNFAGANGTINWRAETRIDDGIAIVYNTLTFTSTADLGNLQFINYLDEDVFGVSDDLLYQTGSPGQADFRAFTLDNTERFGFSQGGVYIPGPGLVNATYNGWAADEYSDLQTIITGTGTTYTPAGNIDTTDLVPFVDPALGNVHGLADITTAFAWTVNPTARSATVTTFLELIPQAPASAGTPGEWKGLTIDKYASDRNVAELLEQEAPNGTAPGANSVTSNAQFLGALGPTEKSGDDNRRLGFTVHGLLNAVNDVDVYSFKADAGTEVWIDIDRTTHALDSVVELIDNDGNVLARSDNSEAEAAGAESLVGLARKMQKTAPYQGRDLYTTNPRDAGFRVVLPGPQNTTNTYHLRVRSSSSDLSNVAGGKSLGAYQLQVRLRETDEQSGSTVQFADVRNATVGIAVLGQPTHSPLAGEVAETTGNNNTNAGAQNIGNLLNSDRGTLSAAGQLSARTDVDWYRMEVNYDAIQSVFEQPEDPSPEDWFATIFDIDYADGFARPNTIISVYDANLNLVLSSRDSNVANDRPRPLNGADVADLDRGSSGAADPFIGVAELPQGTYFVAVSSDAQMPTQFQQYFQAGAANPLFRLEPINSMHRIVEDHIYIPLVDPVPPPATADDPDVDDGQFLSPGGAAIPFHLGDVGLYVVREVRESEPAELSQVITVDPFTGQREVTVGSLGFDIGDAVFRNDFNSLFSYSLDLGSDGEIRDDDSGHYLQIDQGTAATTDLGDDGIDTYELDGAVPPNPVRAHLSFNNQRVGYGIQFDAMDFGDVWSVTQGDAFRGQRLIAVGHRGEDNPGPVINPFLESRENIVYQMNPTTGVGLITGASNRVVGAATSNYEVGEIITAARTRAPEATSIDPATLATITNINDTMTFTVDDGFGVTTFEFDGGPELIQNINPPLGFSVHDGDFFLLDPTDNSLPSNIGDETLLQFESGTALKVFVPGANFPDNIPPAVPPNPQTLPGSVSITDSLGRTLTFEFDRDGVLSNTTSIRVDVSGSLNQQGVSGRLVAAINAQTGANWNVTAAFVGDRIRLTNDTAVSVTNNIATMVAPIGASGKAPVLQALPGSQIVDGTRFQFRVNYLNTPQTYVFEFSDITVGGVDPTPPAAGIVPIEYTQLMTDVQVAIAMNNAFTGLNGGNPNLPPPLTTVRGDSRIAVNGALINAAGNGYFDINSGIEDLTTTLNYVPIAVEDDFTAVQIGSIVGGSLGPPPVAGIVNTNTQFTASADGTRINFPPIIAAGKVPVFDLNVSGVPVWNKVLGAATGVSPGNVPVVFGAAYSAAQVASAMATAITNALQASSDITAIATGPFVRMSNGVLSAPNPPFNTQGQGPGGRVTGIAIHDSNPATNVDDNYFYAVTNRGGLFRVTADLFQNAILDPSLVAKYNQVSTTFIQTSVADLNGINFQGLSFGPKNVEGGRYAEMLFGITDAGRIYAFNTAGVLQPIFANGQTFIDTGVTNARGLDFTNLDSNLWHTTRSRGDLPDDNNPAPDPGHGVNAPYDESRGSQVGARSFQFGRNFGGNYFAPGGAYGTIVSNEFDLTGYSSADQPVLYFNYRADTEGRNTLLSDPSPPFPMLDSIRVSIAGDDGDWLELATNNSSRDPSTPPGINDEYDIYPKIQELFDNANGFRQARVDLADFAGRDHLRLRFDFATGGELNLGDIRTTGEELRSVRGNQLMDGDVFEYDGFIDPITEDKVDGDLFEFDLGFSFQTPSGTAINDGEFFSVDDNISDATPAITFEFDKNGVVTPGRRPIIIDNTFSATQVASAIAQEIRNAFVTIVPVFLDTNFVELPEAENVTISYASALRRVVHGHTLVIPHTKSTGTPIQDGETFTVNDGRNPPRTFEYDLNGSFTPGNVPIVITRFMSEFVIAQRTYNAIAGVLPDAVPRYTTGARVNILSAFSVTQSAVHAVRLETNSTGLGVQPNHTAVVVDRSLSRNQVATAMNGVLEQFYYDQQLLAVAGNLRADGQTFTLSDGVNPTVVFEMDTGYVMSIPTAGGNPLANPLQRVDDGDKITLTNGATSVTYEFDKNGVWNPVNTRVIFSDSASQIFIARALSNAIAATPVGIRNALSINPFWNGAVISGARVQIGGTDPNLTVVARNAANTVITNRYTRTGTPGTTNPAFIPVHFQPSVNFSAADMAQQIRDSINLSPINTVSGVVASVGAVNSANQRRVKLVGPDLTLVDSVAGVSAFTLELGNNAANTVANDMVKQYNDLIRVITHTVYDQGPLGLDNGNTSDAFGAFNSNLRFQNNNFEGVYIDDIIIGFAERGEIGTGSAALTNFDPNPLADPLNVANGTYQLEVRRGPEYGVPGNNPPLNLFRTFNTNDLLTREHQMEAPAGADLRDGQTFVLSDGVSSLTFEFNDLSVANNAITAGNVRIDYRSNFTAAEVARAIQSAINGPDAQAVLDLQAMIGDGTLPGTLISTSNRVNLAGPATYKVEGTPATETNDLLSQATPTNFDGNLFIGSGTIGDNPVLSVNRATEGMDVDMFSIALVAGETVRIDIDAVTLDSNLDSVIRIFDAAGNPVIVNAVALQSDDQLAPGETRIPIAKNPNTGLPVINTIDPYLNFTAPANGIYYIGVSAFGNSTYNPVTGGGVVNATFPSRLGAYQLNISSYGATSFDDISNQNTFDEEFGDKNLFRDQGQIILQGNRVSNSSQFGIVIDSGARVAADGNLSHQGPVRNLREPNTQRLVPGVVVVNNTIFDNVQGGIRFSGDPLPDAPIPFGRIINNTLFGRGGTLENTGATDVGISVTDNASPTLLNNIVANFRQGIFVDASSRTPAFGGTSLSGTVLGGTLFQGNTTNSNIGLGTGSDDFPIDLPNSAALFVDAAERNFYLKEGSQAIDSSIDTLLDRPAMVTVSDPLGISPSPILAPDRDGLGQKRVDDPNVKFTPPGGGFGENVAKDRGAIDRVDFTGPTSRLINPQDNDALGQDNDPTDTVVVLQNQILDNFSIQLIDAFDPFSPLEGSGIDDNSVAARDVTVTATAAGVTRTLVQGLDYSFSYDATNNLIRLNPLGGLWPLSTTYKITLDNDPAADGAIGSPNRTNGIYDLAGNGLLPNHDSGPDFGLVTYTIFLGSALDYGDAPAPYPTLSADDGAAHQIKAGVQLGATNSADADGQPSANADADASDDGVSNFFLTPGANSQVTVNASTAAKLDAWIDLNQDGDWDDASEHIIDGSTAAGDLVPGNNVKQFLLPLGPQGVTYARFRMTSTGIATPTGAALDGEVEDYKVTLSGPAFQNPLNRLDVTGDGAVSPIDALRIINFINRYKNDPFFVNPPNNGNMPLPNPFTGLTGPDYLDTNGDGFVSSIDSLLVVNFLNDPINNPPPTGEGEGEDGGMAPASTRSLAGTSSADASIPAVLYANSSVVVEVKNPAPSQEQVTDHLFGSGSTLAGDSLQPIVDELHPSRRDQKLAVKSTSRSEGGEDAWDDLLGDLAADVGKRRQES